MGRGGLGLVGAQADVKRGSASHQAVSGGWGGVGGCAGWGGAGMRTGHAGEAPSVCKSVSIAD